MTTKPGEGERRAAGGYRPQYLVSASLILKALEQGDLEWIRVADPTAGRVDDIQIATTGRIDAYQVKWAQSGGTVTLRNLTHSTDKEPALFNQLSQGWTELKQKYPNHRVVVHLTTNRIPAYTSSGMPEAENEPNPYTVSAFIEQSWLPTQKGTFVAKDIWDPVWKSLQEVTKLSDREFAAFVQDCRLDFHTQLPNETTDIIAIHNLLFATIASPECIVQLDCDELLSRLGWAQRYRFRSLHKFPEPQFLYRPIKHTVKTLHEKLKIISGGYIGVFGPPGSGKSTFLTQTLRTLPIRLIRYYAYVPDAQDPSVLRGESTNFFHDVTLKLQRIGIGNHRRPDPTDRVTLIKLFHEQLQLLGQDYETSGTRTVILVDGLDHISREQHPQRSLLTDLPLPREIPTGVYITVGSQTKELPDLPAPIQQVLSKDDRTILMERLAPADVQAIIKTTLPVLEQEHCQQIYQLSDGHPLALIYLLKSLIQAESPTEYNTIIENSLPYTGDIEEQYFAHWRKIEDDFELSQLLGLLARIRGPIPMNWVAQWAERPLLQQLKHLFMQYFSSDSQGRWEFFHNSFRIFLETKTADPLPGQTVEQVNQQYHLKLAQYYQGSDPPWQWETLYHYYQAGDFKRVVDIAQYSWFRTQVESLRPIDAIGTDVRLAIKAAGELVDAVALMRHTLVGASLQQRAKALEDTSLPHLLIDAGEPHLAADYARDGARLRINEKQALWLSVHLYNAGLEQDARRIFELAEPLEYLSGRPIPDDHTRPQNLEDWLSAWVESASLLRPSAELVETVRRIQIEPSHYDKDNDIQQVSLDSQNWLLYQGALACCERDDWEGWQIFFEALDEQRDHSVRYFTLLRSIVYLHNINQTEQARQLFQTLVAMEPPKSLGTGRYGIANCLSVAELALFLNIDNAKAIAQEWLDKIEPIPLADREISRENTPRLYDLQFRYARTRFIINKSLKPSQLLQEAENVTTFGLYEEDETKQARRQLNSVVIHLAKLWAGGHLGYQQEPLVFLRETKWILDLIESGWSPQSANFRLEVSGAEADIAKYIITCSVEHGQETLTAIKKEFDLRWTNRPDDWWVGTQREIILVFVDQGVEQTWVKSHLERIEAGMLRDLDLYSRVEQCEEQAKAWLRIGEKELALSMLRQLVQSARGIYHDEDYQLAQWATWLRKTNSLEPSASYERIRLFLRQVASNEESVTGVGGALQIVLQAVFDLSPHKSIQLYKRLLERKTITHKEGITKLLIAALDAQAPPIREVYWITLELVLPLVRIASPVLIAQLIVQADAISGQSSAIEMSQHIVNRIRIDCLSDQRANWFEGVCDGLNSIGISPSQVGIQPAELEKPDYESSGSSLDRNLYLKTGEQLSLQVVLEMIHSVEDLRQYLDDEDRKQSDYFEWHRVGQDLIGRTSSIEQLWEICDLIDSRVDKLSRETYLVKVFTSLSKRFYELGHTRHAKRAIKNAMTLTKPSGWAANWDGGAKYEVMRQMLVVFGEDVREKLVRLYAQDLSERFRDPEQVLIYGKDAAEILFTDIPYTRIWPDIEAYLDELFAGTMVQPQLELETVLDAPLKRTMPDTPDNCLAELLMLYLDFPAYPVSDRAIRVCAEALLEGNRAIEAALKETLGKHDQIVKQGLMVLEAASLQKPQAILSFREQLQTLQKSPNFIIRTTATTINNNLSGQLLPPPRIECSNPVIYSIHLPDIALHKTDQAVRKDANPVLLGDPALVLQPLDIEARALAKIAGVSDTNVLYRAAQKFHELQPHRTWLFNNSQLEPDELSRFLDKVDLRFSHNKPKISPLRNAIAHVAAELYDAGYVPESDGALLASIFRDHDPNFYLHHGSLRPDYIQRIGGLDYSHERYVEIPKDWLDTPEMSLSLLSRRSSDGRIILGEWTRLKRLEEEWPMEERMSLMRETNSYEIWDKIDPETEETPFAWVRGAHITDYWELTDFPTTELVIAHNGYTFQTQGAYWLGFNPRIGFEIGWQPSESGWFRWINQQNHIVVESVWWQDGAFDLFSHYDHVEVGNGWLVLITEEGYQEIRSRFNTIARGGVIKRSLGWLGTVGRGSAVSQIDTRAA